MTGAAALVRRVALPGTAAVLAAVVAAVAVGVAAGTAAIDLVHLLVVVACAVTGGLVARQRPANAVGTLLLGSAACFALLELCGRLALQLPDGPAAAVLAWPSTWLWAPANALLTAAPVHFPDGRPDRRWRWPLRLLAGLAAVAGGLGALRPGPDLQIGPVGRPNPLGVPGLAPAADAAALLLSLYSVLLVTAAALALLHGARRAAPGSPRRPQARWLAYGVGLTSLLVLARLVAGLLDDRPESIWPVRSLVWEVVGNLAGAVLPVVLAIAVVRHRLLDIDRLIGRTVVLVVLSTAVLSAYLLVVAAAAVLLGPALGEAVELPAALVGVGAAALLLAPLRARVQRRVDRMLHGQRGDPYAVLSRLGRQLELAADAGPLPSVVRTLREALQLGAVAIDVGPGAHRTCAGVLPADPVAIPLVAGGERVGALLLGPRPGEDALGPRDLRLLRDLAGPIAGAVRGAAEAERAQRLSHDLQLSRERLVLAREEERRRLRRDLHDGLGPVLAGMSMRADTAREIAGPGPVHDLLAEIVDDAGTALADLRRLVDGLRPPALDTVGLAGAIEAHLAGRPRSGPAVELDLPAPLPPLPAATEVAAYRIALEAVANADRHADARSVRVTLAVDGEHLRVEVLDDGRGPRPTGRTGVGAGIGVGVGVGVASMRERAAELGGSCRVEARPGGGTAVRARLPLRPAEPAEPTGPDREEGRGADPHPARR